MSTTDDTSAARRGSGSNDLLGPLPEPHAVVDIWGHDCPHYTREQMREYARRAVAAERERCALIVEDMVRAVDGADALAAIRKA